MVIKQMYLTLNSYLKKKRLSSEHESHSSKKKNKQKNRSCQSSPFNHRENCLFCVQKYELKKKTPITLKGGSQLMYFVKQKKKSNITYSLCAKKKTR